MPSRPRLSVISHPNVVTLNQLIYLKLLDLGWDLTMIVPSRWKDEYRPDGFQPTPLPGLEDRMRLVPVALSGEPQRHFYLARASRLITELAPDIAFLEQELFSVPALQWGAALRRAGVPFGVQAAENLDRPFPWPARLIRKIIAPRIAFVAARSPRAGGRAREWGARGPTAVVPHNTPPWEPLERSVNSRFTVGYAGRLVPEKGIADLMEAVAKLDGAVRVLVCGDGPLRREVETASLRNATVEVRTGLDHGGMRCAYAEMDVLALPSHTTRTWAEQFGRVLIEALLCGCPVIGSDSGEIPWVIESTGGGLVFPEGDVDALAASLAELQASPERREELASTGRKEAVRLFGVDEAAATMDRLMHAVLAR